MATATVGAGRAGKPEVVEIRPRRARFLVSTDSTGTRRLDRRCCRNNDQL